MESITSKSTTKVQYARIARKIFRRANYLLDDERQRGMLVDFEGATYIHIGSRLTS